MSRTMMRLGPYKFSVDTAAFQEVTRSMSMRWASQQRIGTNDALQMTGIGPETMELRGVVFPQFNAGSGQLNTMRAIASIGTPLPLITGTGRVLGLWVIESVSETQSVFAIKGAAKRQEFSMQLTRYDGGLRALLPF